MLPLSYTTFGISGENAENIRLVYTNVAAISDIGDMDGDGEALHATDLHYADPVRTDRIVVCGKEYEATYFGRMLPDDYGPNVEIPDGIQYLDFWILENAYEDFSSFPSVLYEGEEVLVPFSQFPMKITEGQIIRIEGGMQDGTIGCEYYCSDGRVYQGVPAARQIEVKE